MDVKTTVWTVHWKMNKIGGAPIDESQTFMTFTSALSFARQLSSEIDISQCLDFMRNNNSLVYQKTMADLIEKVIVKCGFLDYKEDIPSLDPQDYSGCSQVKLPTNINNFSMKFEEDFIYFKYLDQCQLKARIYFLSEHPENLTLLTLFKFRCENKSFLNEGDISFLEIMLERKKKKVCSSGKYSIKHSVQILESLRKNDNPLRICDIVELTGIRDRRTIVRNISKLIDSGFDIRRDENKGYYIPKTKEILTSKDMQLIRESIDLNCRISPEDKERIISLLSRL